MNQVGYANPQPPAAPETMLAGSISSLEAYLNDLGVTADHLSQKLAPVMSPDNVARLAGDPSPEKTQQLSPTVERIAAVTERVRRITERLQQTASRLEV